MIIKFKSHKTDSSIITTFVVLKSTVVAFICLLVVNLLLMCTLDIFG